jgi:hypothetical protein
VPDPFGTAAVRDRVLAAWAASPARFREDANAEQDLTHGAYRDRLLVELAQNAADAAARSGVDGRLRLSLVDGQLLAANTGAPLDAGRRRGTGDAAGVGQAGRRQRRAVRGRVRGRADRHRRAVGALDHRRCPVLGRGHQDGGGRGAGAGRRAGPARRAGSGAATALAR